MAEQNKEQETESYDKLFEGLTEEQEKKLGAMSHDQLLRYIAENNMHIKQLYVLLSIAGEQMGKMADRQGTIVAAMNLIIEGLTAKKIDDTDLKKSMETFLEIQEQARKYSA